jgi:hypothetical protein
LWIIAHEVHNISPVVDSVVKGAGNLPCFFVFEMVIINKVMSMKKILLKVKYKKSNQRGRKCRQREKR